MFLIILACSGPGEAPDSPRGDSAPELDSEPQDSPADSPSDSDCPELSWYVDGDGDGFGAGELQSGCELPPEGVANGQDCDDSDPLVFPGADELCDGLDNDCDPETQDHSLSFVSHEGATELLSNGSPGAPAELSLEDGTLQICAGTYYLELELDGVVVEGAGLEETLLEGQGRDIVELDGSATLRDLSLRGGEIAVTGFRTSVELERVGLLENEVAMYLLGSRATLSDCVVEDNTASLRIWTDSSLNGSAFTLRDSRVAGSEEAALHLQYKGTLELDNVELEGNAYDVWTEAGQEHLASPATLSCDWTSCEEP